jgi:hypothetical protein
MYIYFLFLMENFFEEPGEKSRSDEKHKSETEIRNG